MTDVSPPGGGATGACFGRARGARALARMHVPHPATHPPTCHPHSPLFRTRDPACTCPGPPPPDPTPQMRKAANRTAFDFAKAEEEYIDGDEVVGLGNLGSKVGGPGAAGVGEGRPGRWGAAPGP
jgi:hypothetical protein